MRDIMDACTDKLTRRVVFQKPTQIGATEGIILNFIGYTMDHAPGPGMLLGPKLDWCKKFSRRRLASMINDTPCLRDLVQESSKRDGTNNLLQKLFPGGSWTLVGANSTTDISSDPIKYAVADEVDRNEVSAGDEGDALELLFNRTRTFWDRKEIITSSPANLSTSRIVPAFKGSDQRLLFVPCPACDEYQTLKWARIEFQNKDPETTVYRCEYCGEAITERYKRQMLQAYQWRGQAPFRGIAGFWCNQFASPFTTWAECVDEYLRALPYPEKYKVWINTVLAEAWEDKIEGETLEQSKIEDRKEPYAFGTVPAGGCVVLATADTQNDRLEVNVVAWGPNHESWRIDHVVLLGDPSHQAVWDELTEVLKREYDHESGAKLRIRACGIDTGGGRTQAVYNFCALQSHPCPVIALKGANQRGAPIIDVDQKGNIKSTVRQAQNRRRFRLYMVGVHFGKDLLYAKLNQPPEAMGAMHFSEDCTPEYFGQLTAEVRVEHKAYGVPYHVWEPIAGRRNEAFDLEVYQLFLIRFAESAGISLQEEADKLAGPKAPAPFALTAPNETQNQPPRKRKSSMSKW